MTDSVRGKAEEEISIPFPPVEDFPREEKEFGRFRSARTQEEFLRETLANCAMSVSARLRLRRMLERECGP
jgi:hypothetical protein